MIMKSNSVGEERHVREGKYVLATRVNWPGQLLHIGRKTAGGRWQHGEHNFAAVFFLLLAFYCLPLFIRFFLPGSCQVLAQQGGAKRTSVQHREFHRILHVESPFPSIGELHVGC